MMAALDPTAPLPRGTTLIEASAGTGKTFTITSLVLRLVVEEALPIDQILVVTFTEAATSELRDRVRGRLREAMLAFRGSDCDDELIGSLVTTAHREGSQATALHRLEAALADFDRAAIHTIHGFCRRMLRENAFESAVPFDTELLVDQSPLLDEVVADFWVHECHRAPEDLFRYLVRSKDRDHPAITPQWLREVARLVLAHRRAPVLPPSPPVVPQPDELAWRDSVGRALELLGSHRTQLEVLLEHAELHKRWHGKRYASVAHLLDQVESWLCRPATRGEVAGDAISHLTPTAIEAKTYAAARRAGRVPRHPFFDACAEVLHHHAAWQHYYQAQAQALVLRLPPWVKRQVDLRKRARHQQSFGDLLHLLLEAVHRGGGLVQVIRDRYRAALIDEFQDTDPVQYGIFSRVFGEAGGWLFLIGDPKQAIYAFRGADVYAYLRASEDADRREGLDVNWRSDERLVDAIGSLFEGTAAPFLEPRITWAPVRAHHQADRLVFPDGPKAPLLFRHVDLPGGKSTKNGPPRVSKGAVNAELPRLVALDVAEFLSSGARLGDRDVEPGDVAVLVRSNAQGRWMLQELRAVGIPSVLRTRSTVFAAPEADELRRLLAAVAEPTRAGLVRAALATDLIGLSATDLDGLVDDEASWEVWVERLRRLHRVWSERGFLPMLHALLDEADVQARLLVRVDGERRMTDLRHLAELLHRASQEEDLGIAGLMRWLTQQTTQAGPEADAEQIRLESDSRAVQIVTIHKAKGLQYPVVWCPWLWEGSLRGRGRRSAGYVSYHDPDDDWAMKVDLGSDELDRHRERAEFEAQADSLRLLYVALTRAEHRCTVYWGPFSTIETSPLGLLLHPAPDTGVQAAAVSPVADLDSEQMRRRLDTLVQRSRGTIEVHGPVEQTIEAWRPPTIDASELAARQVRRQPDPHWRTASFTHLSSRAPQAGPAAEGLDHDAAAPLPQAARERDSAPVVLHQFTKGARAGTFLHKVLELVDFGAPESLPELVARQLRDHGFPVEPWAEVVSAGLDAVLRTPLTTKGLRLCDVPRARRLDELEFVFPVVHDPAPTQVEPQPGDLPFASARRPVDPRRLASVFHAHRSPVVPPGYPARVRELGFEPLRGYLKGFIDLVFTHRGRWYLVDYKSNHLGDHHEDYAPAHLAVAMSHHHYVLQYHLYAVALHRYLRWRVPGYRYQRHFGGVRYLFLRGMSPQTGTRTGVFADRPSTAAIHALDSLLGGGE